MTKDNIAELLTLLNYDSDGNIYTKHYNSEVSLSVDITGNGHISYRECGITVGRETTSNLVEPESLVVLTCVDKLLSKGYQPQHLELEPAWRLGHSNKSGYADIWIRTYREGQVQIETSEKQSLCIIECKTWGNEFDGAWKDTLEDGAQLFSYFQQERGTKFLCLYTTDIIDGETKQDYRLVNVQDNQDFLETDNSLKGYNTATNNKELFSTWRDTYHCEYATRGLFEDDIAPYEIGKNKYTVYDLDPVSSDTIQKKYNEFALILRQHNVGGHENAFDKLVNLFLAKVVDETNNRDDLQFYWKGSAYDDAYRLQDRLQRLYRDGMKRFLNEDVTYIEDSEIEKAFRRFRNDPDATKRTIKEYFRALKFFSDNDFSFISVHNKRLFEQNAAILLKVVKMLQDIKLKGSDQNQLLGDLFEGFLNKGVKQSEGQYFTPMPIVRFLVSSLPLEQFIRDREELPCAIDYACGAGHFLTEYAVQIEEFVRKYRPDIPLTEYYARITGIEKEYRLSKVSKVSAFMYGHDEINIIYTDALAPHPDIRDGSYDILIANPPYSVKGFLEMLTEQQRKQYSLFSNDLNLGKNNAIETFFIERAAQLLRAGGVAGIILPVSVLNKNGIFAHAREIILQKFDIVSIAEFGSGTFGKTPTNTFSLFLRRKETNTPDAEHLSARVASWFDGHNETDEVYDDSDLLDAYCEHLGYSLDDYRTFLSGTLTESFMSHDTIQAYHSAFFGNGRNAMKGVCNEAKEIRSCFVNRQRTQAYRRQAEELQQKEANAAFLQFVTAIEREKVYYYLLCATVTNPVVIVKAPSTNTEIKRFLGYDWCDSKGNEGIKYLNVTVQNGDEDDGDEDDNTMQQIRGIDGINTPLFNPANLYDPEKINSIIRAVFTGDDLTIPDELSSKVEVYSLVDLIDFSRTDFNKEIKTTPILSYPQIESKYPSEKIGTIAPYVTDKVSINSIDISSYVTTANMLQNRAGVESTNEVPDIERVTAYKAGDILVSNIRPYLKKIWLSNRDGGCSNDVLVFRNIKQKEYDTKYLHTILSLDIFFDYMMVGKTGLKMPRGDKKIIPNFLIPKPPMNIQQKIVSKCKIVDDKYKEANHVITKCISERQKIINKYIQGNCPTTELEYLLQEVTGYKTKIDSGEINSVGKYPVVTQEKNVLISGYTDHEECITDLPLIVFGDHSCSFKYVDFEFVRGADGTQLLKTDPNEVLSKYLYYYLLSIHIENDGRYERHFKYLKKTNIPKPPIDVQKRIIAECDMIETELQKANKVISECSVKKQSILDKYLK